MGIYADKMSDLTISVKSDDNNVKAVADGSAELDIAFRPGMYRRYDEADLERQLSSVLERVSQGRRAAHLRALAEATGEEPRRLGDYELGHREREFRDLVATLSPRGRSPGDIVKLSNVGMRDWEVRIRPGALGGLAESELAREVVGAYERLQRDWRLRKTEARVRVYGPSRDSRLKRR